MGGSVGMGGSMGRPLLLFSRASRFKLHCFILLGRTGGLINCCCLCQDPAASMLRHLRTTCCCSVASCTCRLPQRPKATRSQTFERQQPSDKLRC